MTNNPLRVAVIIPCFNEAIAIPSVLREFGSALPGAELHVFDNNSVDDTAAIAKANGALVTSVRLQGKGNVVRRMFADVEADIYVMVDGDATYSAAKAAEHVELLVNERLDMVLGMRTDDFSESTTYRRGHRWGNQMLTRSVMWLFGGTFTDMLSGYRIFSRRYVKSFPAQASGFETETELTIHALELRMPCRELPVDYRARPEGSVSKLSTYRDGWRILKTILKIVIAERPLAFFAGIGLLLSLVAIGISIPLLMTYMQSGLVPRFPTAMLATGLMLTSILSFTCGLLLQHITLARQEAKHLAYLREPAPSMLN